MGFFDFLTEEIAIDLGTANTLIIHNDKVVVDSPSIVARDRISGKIIAVGKEANLMQGKTHENIKTIRPLKDGVIADFDASEQMISMFIKNIPALKKKLFTPALRMVVCIPSGITEVEMRAVKESCERVNGKEVYLIHEPMAAAIGIGIDIMQPKGNMIVDIGGGTTDLAVFKDGIIRHTAVIPFGGNVVTEDIKEGCSIIEKQAELLKIKFGSAWPGENKDNEIVSIPGLRGREPKEITLKNLSKIIHARVVEIIEQVYVEIKNYGHEEQKKKLIAGIVLTGGGAQLKHLKQLVEYITGMDTRIGYPNEHLAGGSDDDIASPLYATAVGLVMDGLKRQERRRIEKEVEEMSNVAVEHSEENISQEEEVIESPRKERKSFLDKLTERVKDFLDNAE